MSKTLFHALILCMFFATTQLLLFAYLAPNVTPASKAADLIAQAKKILTSPNIFSSPQKEQILLNAISSSRVNSYRPSTESLINLYNYYKSTGQEKRIYSVVNDLTKCPHYNCGELYIANRWTPEISTAKELIECNSPELALAYLNRIIEDGGGPSKYRCRRAIQMKISLLQQTGRTNELVPTQKLLASVDEEIKDRKKKSFFPLDTDTE